MRRFRHAATAAAFAGLIAAAGYSALAGRVDAVVTLGKTATVTVTRPGDVATAGFLVQAGTAKKVQVVVKLAKKSKLAIGDVRLVAPDGTIYDSAGLAAIGGKSKVTTKLATLMMPNVPDGKGGLWRVEVRGNATTAGGATVQVKGSDVASVVPPKSGETIVPDGEIEKTIDVGSNQAISVTITRAVKQTAIKPQLQILDPFGNPLDGGAYLGKLNTKAGSLSLKGYRLPVFGRYTLVVSGVDGGGGAVKIAAKTAKAKAAKGAPVAVAPVAVGSSPTLPTMLDGTSSRGGTGPLTYLWTQVAGPAVVLGGPATAGPTFTAPDATGALAFELAVSQNGVWSAPVAVAVDVAMAPLADAGRSQSVAAAANVTLDGSGSHDRGTGGLSYLWRQDPADPVQVTLTGGTTAAPTFKAPSAAGLLHFGLVVDDGTLASPEDWVTVRVGDPASATPDAGRSQIVSRMSTVHLSALATLTPSGALDVPLVWEKVSGPAVTLADATSPWPSFTAPKTNADFVFRLTAGGATDLVTVLVRGGETNLAPLSRGNGTQTAASGNVPLDASASTDPESRPLTFRWAQTAGDALPPADRAAGATTVPLPAGSASRTYAVIANDGLANGPPDLVAVRNTGYAGDPVAVAGADVSLPSTVTVVLDGRGSFRTQGSGPLTYRWRQISARDWFDVDAVSATFDPDAAYTTFTLPAGLSSRTPRRTLTFELIVNDGTADSAPDLTTVTFTGIPTNGRPVVIVTANPPSPILGETVTLTAQVTEPDDDTYTISWSQTGGPNVVLAGSPTGLQRTFVSPASGDLQFTCTADDGFTNGQGSDAALVHVNAAPVADFTLSESSGPPGTAVGVDATGSADGEGASLTYHWSLLPGSAFVQVPQDTATRTWNFQAPTGTVGVRLVVNDGRQNSLPRDKQFFVGAPIDVTASASPSISGDNSPVTAFYGEPVTLTAVPEGEGTITYQWRQLTGGDNAIYANDPDVGTIDKAAQAEAEFTVPLPSSGPFGTSPSATFEVRASNGVNSATATVTVQFRASFNNAQLNQIALDNTAYGIITKNCMGSTCHGSTAGAAKCTTAQGYPMGTAQVFRSNSIGVAACYNGKTRVAASNSTGSALIDRLKNISGSPSIMPQGSGGLGAGPIGLIEDWINQGTLDN